MKRALISSLPGNRSSTALAMAAALVVVSPLPAQEVPVVAPGDRVKVTRWEGPPLRGRLVSASDGGLVVDPQGGEPVSLASGQVRSLAVSRGHGRASPWIGVGGFVLANVGFGVAGAFGSEEKTRVCTGFDPYYSSDLHCRETGRSADRVGGFVDGMRDGLPFSAVLGVLSWLALGERWTEAQLGGQAAPEAVVGVTPDRVEVSLRIPLGG